MMMMMMGRRVTGALVLAVTFAINTADRQRDLLSRDHLLTEIIVMLA